jgi:hypothetical protein
VVSLDEREQLARDGKGECGGLGKDLKPHYLEKGRFWREWLQSTIKKN